MQLPSSRPFSCFKNASNCLLTTGDVFPRHRASVLLLLVRIHRRPVVSELERGAERAEARMQFPVTLGLRMDAGTGGVGGGGRVTFVPQAPTLCRNTIDNASSRFSSFTAHSLTDSHRQSSSLLSLVPSVTWAARLHLNPIDFVLIMRLVCQARGTVRWSGWERGHDAWSPHPTTSASPLHLKIERLMGFLLQSLRALRGCRIWTLSPSQSTSPFRFFSCMTEGV